MPEVHFHPDRGISETKLLDILDGNIPAYEDFELPDDYASDVSNLLPPSIVRSEHMEYWGDKQSDDFTIWRTEEDRVAIIEARVDARKPDDALLSGLLILAKRWKCVLVETKYQTICMMTPYELGVLIYAHFHRSGGMQPDLLHPLPADPSNGTHPVVR